jgi:hypothetical protein
MTRAAERPAARAATASVVVAASVLAACGGGGSLSRSAYAARADSICQAIAVPAPKPGSAQQAAANARQQAEARAGALARLRPLRPPGSIAAAVKRFLDSSQAGLDDYRAMARAAQRNDRPSYELASLEQAMHAVDRTRAAADAGLSVCGQPTRPLSDAALVASADAACRTADQTIVDRPRPRSTGAPGLAASLPGTYSAALASLRRLRVLQPNPATEATWRTFLSVYEQRVRAIGDALSAARAGNGAGMRAAARRDDTLAGQESGLAAELGLELCGRVGALGV